MTREELQSLLEEAVERKLRELLGMEEDGLLREDIRQRLVRQLTVVETGERGISLDEMTAALDDE